MQVGYLRVSTADDRQTTDLQHDALIAAGIDERHLYQDRASGARDDRPGLKRCLAYLHPGDVLVVWRLDRLGRSLPHLVEIVTDLQRRGIGFKSLTETIDTTTATGELLFHLFAALAQYERSLTRERVLAGLESARRRNRHGGRPRRIGPEALEVAQSLIENGKTISAAARAVGVPRQTLVDALRRLSS